jgi:hypothetical protein
MTRLIFKEFATKGKSKMHSIYNVYDFQNGIRLGTIAWYPPWRQFVFEAHTELWAHESLDELSNFIKQLMVKK